jgi:calcineurin-like phosphoesterase family protein
VACLRLLLGVAVCTVAIGCSRDEPSKPPSGAGATEMALPGAIAMIAVGDIGVCGAGGDEATARIVDSLLIVDSVAGVQRVVITIGDNAYSSGGVGPIAAYTRCFAPSWGTPRIMNVVRPSPGNHDYDSGSGAPYFDYFGQRAGPRGKGYYSFDVGDWHVVSLNSELYFGRGNPAEAKAQEDWLRRDLSGNHKQCTLAYFHRPRFSSGSHRGTPEMQPLWTILHDADADLIINGHEHDYERFVPQTPAGAVDSARGIPQIVAGTGGAVLRGIRSRLAANSVIQIHGHYGVLKLALGAGEYRHAFLDTEGRIWDAGTGKCH